MEAKQFNSQMIQELTNIAQHAVQYLQAPAGHYTSTQLLRWMDKHVALWTDGLQVDEAIHEEQVIKIDTFVCRFLLMDAFYILQRFEILYKVPSAKRAKFYF